MYKYTQLACTFVLLLYIIDLLFERANFETILDPTFEVKRKTDIVPTHHDVYPPHLLINKSTIDPNLKTDIMLKKSNTTYIPLY